MNNLTDQQLLRDYTGSRSEAAFAELVRRHVDVVYSAALRMVRDIDLAEDVAQGVFVALAQSAPQLRDRPVLSGWLHRTTQNLAANTVRSDVRRRARELEAAAMNELHEPDPLSRRSETQADVWEHIAPHLDNALGELSEADRDALLLRYFQRKSAREMAQTLGTSEDAAQKRVSRAVERLREFLAKRDVTVGASGLVVVISANAVQAVPVGLAVTISTAAAIAGTTLATTATATATKAIAMTTLQKTIIGATLAAVVGAGIYEARRASILRNQVQTLQQQQGSLAEQIQKLTLERNETAQRLVALSGENELLKRNGDELPKLRGEVARLRANAKEPGQLQAAANDPFVATALDWKAKEAQLRELMEQRPNQKIPEIQFLNDRIWLDVARDANLDTETGIRKALSRLRFIGGNNFANMLRKALREYAQANNGEFPGDISQLKPYFGWSVDDAMLKRYVILPTDANDFPPDLSFGGRWVITEETSVDPEHDSRWIIGNDRFTSISFQKFDEEKALAPYLRALAPVKEAFSVANNGQQPTDPSRLAPYLRTPEEQAALQKVLQARKSAAK